MTGLPGGAHRLRSILGNAGTLTGGRLSLAVLRFAATLMLVQRAGLDRFGEFALILSIVMVAEWLSDFGLADVAVRQIAADPKRRRATMSAFAVSKAVQGVLAAAVMGAGMSLAGYAEHIVRSGLIAGAAVVLYAGVQIYRVEFRSRLQLGRDVTAELVSAVVFMLAIWLATGVGASLEGLTLCYVLSRAVNLLVAAALARAWPEVVLDRAFRAELRVLARACVPLGLTGLMVSSYDAMEQIALSHWSTSAEVGIFSFAMRIMMLALVVEQALATAVFPVLAAQWAHDREAFTRTLQAVLNWGLLIAGALFCALHTSAYGLLALVKSDPQPVAEVLRWLAWAIPARAAVALVGPMLVISGRLSRAVWIPLVVVAAKWGLLTVLASRGAVGAAMAFLIAEIGIGLLPNLLFCQFASGVWLKWSVPLRIIAAAIAVALSTSALGLTGTLLQGVLATFTFLALAAALGAIQLKPLRQLMLNLANRRNGRT